MATVWSSAMSVLGARASLVAGIFAAIGASLCCVVPVVLLGLGIGGAWMGHLTALAPYRPIFVGLTLVFLGLAFRQLYLVPQVCEPGTSCADPRTQRRQRITFWIVGFSILGLLATPMAAGIFY